MAVKLTKGVEVLNEITGKGPAANDGAVVTYNARFFLRKGDEVTQDADIISRAREHVEVRMIDGVELIDHVTVIGKRRVIAGVEMSLRGMRKNGYREVVVSPHLGYGHKGVANLIPANALLRIQLWVRDVRNVV